MIHYKVKRKKYPKGGNVRELEDCYLAVPVRCKRVDAHVIGTRLCYASSLTRSDVMAVVSGLLDEMKRTLFDGDTLVLDHIGTFWISTTNDKCTDPNELTPSKVKAKRICFRASDELRRELSLAEFILRK